MQQKINSEAGFDNRAFYRLVASLVLPMAIQNLINVATTSADVFMLGSLGDAVLSGASLAGQLQFILNLFFFGLTSGACVLTAQYWGKGDTRTIEKVLGISMRFALIMTLIFFILAAFFPYAVMNVFSTEQDVIEQGAKYLRIVSVSYVFVAISMIYLNICRSIQRVVISTVVYFISLIVNIILNYILIFGKLGFPALGIEGAAYATVAARGVGVAVVIFYAVRMNKTVRFRLKDMFAHEKQLFKDFLRYSIPVTINELIWGGGTALNAVVIGHLGKTVVSANSVAQMTRQLATVVAFGIASATAIIVGKAIGEGNTKLAEIYARKMTWLSLAAGCLGAVIILLLRSPLAYAMSLSAESTEYLRMMMTVMSYFVIAQAMNTVFIVGIFRAGGDTRFGLVMDATTMYCGSILFGALAAFVFKWNVTVVYILLMSDELIKIPFSLWRYRTKKWLNNVTRDFSIDDTEEKKTCE